MDGMAIVRHGLSMLLRNLGPALRVSLGPLAIALALQALLAALGLGGLGIDPEARSVTGSPGASALGGLLSAAVFLFAFCWAAVAWHRYVLKEEAPGMLPPLRQDLIWPYLGRSVVIGIVLALIAVPLSFVLVLVVGASGSLAAGAAVGLALWLVLGWVGLRLSLTLPARAVERPIGFGEAWALSAPASGAILVAGLILGVVNVGLALIFAFVLGQNAATLALNLGVQWATTMLGLSILTTLYGHLVERRPLTA